MESCLKAVVTLYKTW